LALVARWHVSLEGVRKGLSICQEGTRAPLPSGKYFSSHVLEYRGLIHTLGLPAGGLVIRQGGEVQYIVYVGGNWGRRSYRIQSRKGTVSSLDFVWRGAAGVLICFLVPRFRVCSILLRPEYLQLDTSTKKCLCHSFYTVQHLTILFG
jgi:hypothetical protein